MRNSKTKQGGNIRVDDIRTKSSPTKHYKLYNLRAEESDQQIKEYEGNNERY